MIPLSGDCSAAPADPGVHGGAALVDNSAVSEGEHAVTGRGGAGGQAEALRLAGGGGGGHLTVTPAVGDHTAISLCGGGTPGQGRVSIGALVVLHTSVGEGKHTGGTSGGGAGVGNSLLETETSQPHGVMAGSCRTPGQT